MCVKKPFPRTQLASPPACPAFTLDGLGVAVFELVPEERQRFHSVVCLFDCVFACYLLLWLHR